MAILLAALLLSLAPVSHRLEDAYYDLLQRLRDRPGSSQVVLVNTGVLTGGTVTVWDTNAFPDLLTALGRAGARLIIPVEPPPSAMSLPDSAQLAALAEIQRRSRNEANDLPHAGDSSEDRFGVQLAELRRRSNLHLRTEKAIASLGNLIIAAPTFDGTPGFSASSTTCAKHILDAKGAGIGIGEADTRRVRAVAPPPDSLCQPVLGAGHVEFWPDADGIVRRLDLLVSASGTLVPSAALRAVLAGGSQTENAATVSREVANDSLIIRRAMDAPAILMRFYPWQYAHPSFDTIQAVDVLRSRGVADRIAGRIVILGDTGIGAEPTYMTPVADSMPTATLLATGLSNLLENDYLTRPAWLGWLENGLLILIGAAVLLCGNRLSPIRAVMVGIFVAAGLLATEAGLVLVGRTWPQLATAAVFAVFSTSVIRLLHPRSAQDPLNEPILAPAAAGATFQQTRITADDELDLAFSMLRHQAPSDHVKKRLYDIALEHARRRDLAKAERVLRHLASLDPDYRNAGEKLKKLAGMRKATREAPAPATAQSLRPIVQPTVPPGTLNGQTIGRYQIEQPIGQGAMATVYLGRDPKINRQVAIKTIALAEEFSDTNLANARTQFLREAESAGRLNHPNIISIYDAGEDGQVAYLAMEYFRGRPLSLYAQQGHLLEPRQVFDLMARAAEALHYAHGQHVVHRDVKPANLLYDAKTDSLKITDFGIARLTDSSRTKTGIILGTPSYMSPEQLAGTSVTGQSDLFSLGVTLYQLLTGTPPFRADSIPMLMQKIAHERHERITRLREDLPPCTDEILDHALAKDPADRYASGRAMALALRDCCGSLKTETQVQP